MVARNSSKLCATLQISIENGEELSEKHAPVSDRRRDPLSETAPPDNTRAGQMKLQGECRKAMKTHHFWRALQRVSACVRSHNLHKLGHGNCVVVANEVAANVANLRDFQRHDEVHCQPRRKSSATSSAFR